MLVGWSRSKHSTLVSFWKFGKSWRGVFWSAGGPTRGQLSRKDSCKSVSSCMYVWPPRHSEVVLARPDLVSFSSQLVSYTNEWTGLLNGIRVRMTESERERESECVSECIYRLLYVKVPLWFWHFVPIEAVHFELGQDMRKSFLVFSYCQYKLSIPNSTPCCTEKGHCKFLHETICLKLSTSSH